jgi:hypothetical protein
LFVVCECRTDGKKRPLSRKRRGGGRCVFSVFLLKMEINTRNYFLGRHWWIRFKDYFNVSWQSVFSLLRSLFRLNLTAIQEPLAGKPKNDREALRSYLDCHLATVGQLGYPKRDPEYVPWSVNTVDDVQALLKTNPLMFPALEWERSADNKNVFYVTTYGSAERAVTSRFGRFVSSFGGMYRRVNATFDANFQMIAYQVYKSNGEVDATVSSEEAARALGCLLIIFGQIVHSALHIYHHLLTSCLIEAGGNRELRILALEYAENVPLKFLEVEQLLLSATGTFEQDLGHIPAARLHDMIGELLSTWFSCATVEEFHSEFLFKSTKPLKTLDYGCAGKDYLDHADLLPLFASDLANALHDTDVTESMFLDAENRLCAALSTCVPQTPSISSFKAFFEMMAVTGLVHGASISMTRFQLSALLGECFGRGDELVYSKRDQSLLLTGLSTIVGLVDEKSIFACPKTLSRSSPRSKVIGVFQKYKDMTDALREECYQRTKSGPAAYILADWWPSNFDSRQSTRATYI